MAAVRGAFEFQGQKCSAASRLYVPTSMWSDVRDRMVAMMREIRMGDVRDFRNFMGAVIDQKAFTKISGYVEDAKQNARVVQGGGCRGGSSCGMRRCRHFLRSCICDGGRNSNCGRRRRLCGAC